MLLMIWLKLSKSALEAIRPSFISIIIHLPLSFNPKAEPISLIPTFPSPPLPYPFSA